MTDPKPEPETTQIDTSKLVKPNEDASTEPTPIGDAVSQELSAPETADPVKVDIKRALDRETQDGKGDEDPGPSDFQGFATEGVEKEDSQ